MVRCPESGDLRRSVGVLKNTGEVEKRNEGLGRKGSVRQSTSKLRGSIHTFTEELPLREGDMDIGGFDVEGGLDDTDEAVKRAASESLAISASSLFNSSSLAFARSSPTLNPFL
jgi:hypothetical protein